MNYTIIKILYAIDMFSMFKFANSLCIALDKLEQYVSDNNIKVDKKDLDTRISDIKKHINNNDIHWNTNYGYQRLLVEALCDMFVDEYEKFTFDYTEYIKTSIALYYEYVEYFKFDINDYDTNDSEEYSEAKYYMKRTNQKLIQSMTELLDELLEIKYLSQEEYTKLLELQNELTRKRNDKTFVNEYNKDVLENIDSLLHYQSIVE